jgi:leader peptidase (prepilin peptidase)/N-methyltransferase
MEVLYAVEFALLTFAGFHGWLPVAAVPAFLFVTAAMTTMAVIDYDTHYVYDSMVNWSAGVTLVLLAVASLINGDWWSLLHAVIGAVSLFGVYLLFLLYFRFVRHINGVGAGDLGVAIVIGLPLGYLGLYQTVVGFFSIFIIGMVVIVGMLIARAAGHHESTVFKADDQGDQVADGDDGGRLATAHVPFMLAGMLTGMLLGNAFVWWFLSLFGLSMFY